MQIEMWPIERVREYERNPRRNDQAVAAVAASIREYGFKVPVVVDRDGILIAGHTRLKAARRLGLTEVPVIRADDLTPQQVAAFRLADNKLHELSDWNYDLLPIELAGLQEMNYDLGLLGFDQDELARLLDPGVKDGLCDPDLVPEPPDEAVTKPGDLWILGEHRLLCGDSGKAEDVDRLLNGAPIHLVNTDPPYNVKVEPRSNNAIAAGLSSFGESNTQPQNHHQAFDVARQGPRAPTHKKLRPKDRPLANDFVSDEAFDQMLHAWFGNLARVLQPGRAFYIWGGYANCANYPPVLKATGLYFSQAIIWVKEHPVLTRKDFMGNHEWCQPPDTSVLTASGSSAIQGLRDGDRVVSFSRHHSMMVGLRHGQEARTTSRRYKGPLYGVAVGPRTSWATDGHIWSVRMTPAAKTKWCVYLMHRGPWWRVGRSKLYTTWGLGVKQRLEKENGDGVWILKTFDTREEASTFEQIVSVAYGIPPTFWTEANTSRRNQAMIRQIYEQLDLDQMELSARQALAEYGRTIYYPLVTRDQTRHKYANRVSLLARSCNLIPEVMAVPIPVRGQATSWEPIRAVDVQPYDGSVYSMSVEKYHHYVADGIVTHNCFYGWREGAAHVFLGPNNATDVWSVKKVNPQNMVHLCLHPDALVLTEAGFRAIRSVAVGNRVFAGDGAFHRVKHVSSHPYTSEHLHRIVAKGGNADTLASDNHPFLIWRPVQRARRIIGGDVGWVRADEVRAGDYTMTPVLAESGADPFPELDEDDWFLFGLYLAQGHLQRAGHGDHHYPVFSLHKRRHDLADRIWNKWPQAREYDPNDYRREPSGGTTVMAFDSAAGARFAALGGRLAQGKRLAPACFALPRAKRTAILQGWLNGDGCMVHDRTYWQGSTVSADLAAHLCLLAESVGYRANLYAYDPPEEPGGIGRRRFQSRRRVYYLYFYELGRLARRGCPLRLKHDGREYSLRRVKRVERVPYCGPVWNMSVAGHPSFQTAVGLSHNTEKPVELAVRAMQYSSRPGENVLDLFGGSGSTLIGAEQTGRKAFLMELDPLYADVICERFLKFSGVEPVRESDGAKWSSLRR